MNDISATIFYDQRLAISADIPIPVVWRCTKVEQVSPKGISRLTFAQNNWDEKTDYIERDKDGYVVGIWCDYYANGIPPQDDSSTPLIRGEITTKAKPQIRLGGGFKLLEVHFYDGDTEIEFEPGEWKFFVGEEEISDKLSILTAADSDKVELNQIKIKLPNENNSNESLLGKIIKCQFSSLTGVVTEYEISIVSL